VDYSGITDEEEKEFAKDAAVDDEERKKRVDAYRARMTFVIQTKYTVVLTYATKTKPKKGKKKETEEDNEGEEDTEPDMAKHRLALYRASAVAHTEGFSEHYFFDRAQLFELFHVNPKSTDRKYTNGMPMLLTPFAYLRYATATSDSKDPHVLPIIEGVDVMSGMVWVSNASKLFKDAEANMFEVLIAAVRIIIGAVHQHQGLIASGAESLTHEIDWSGYIVEMDKKFTSPPKLYTLIKGGAVKIRESSQSRKQNGKSSPAKPERKTATIVRGKRKVPEDPQQQQPDKKHKPNGKTFTKVSPKATDDDDKDVVDMTVSTETKQPNGTSQVPTILPVPVAIVTTAPQPQKPIAEVPAAAATVITFDDDDDFVIEMPTAPVVTLPPPSSVPPTAASAVDPNATEPDEEDEVFDETPVIM